MINKVVTIFPGDKEKRIVDRTDGDDPIVEIQIKDKRYKGRIVKISSLGKYNIEILENL